LASEEYFTRSQIANSIKAYNGREVRVVLFCAAHLGVSRISQPTRTIAIPMFDYKKINYSLSDDRYRSTRVLYQWLHDLLRLTSESMELSHD